MGILRLVTVAAALSLGIQGSFAQIGLHSAAEIEQRNAAAAFAVTREMGRALLLGECKRLMASSSPAWRGLPAVGLSAIGMRWRPHMPGSIGTSLISKYTIHRNIKVNPERLSRRGRRGTTTFKNPFP